jgi:hypothetical protein
MLDIGHVAFSLKDLADYATQGLAMFCKIPAGKYY